MKSRLVRTALALLVLCQGSAFAQDNDNSKVRLVTTKVAGGISMIEGVDGFAGGNVAVSVGDDGVFIVDDELEQMSPDRVWTYLLHDVYGYDLKEVSQITGVSLSAAQSRLVRGRREVHERIRMDEALSRFLRHYAGDE